MAVPPPVEPTIILVYNCSGYYVQNYKTKKF